MRIVKVEYLLDLVGVKECGKHLGLDFVYSGKGIILLDIEHGAGAAQSIETVQTSILVKICQYLRASDLVELCCIFLYDYEGVRCQIRPCKS